VCVVEEDDDLAAWDYVRDYLRRNPIDVPKWATMLRGFPRILLGGQFLLAALFGAIGILKLVDGRRGNGVAYLLVAILYASIACGVWAYFRAKLRFQYVAESYIHEMLTNFQFQLDESARAKAAADVRHEGNRRRQEEAKQFYNGQSFKNTASASRAIAEKFHVVPKVAEKWIRSWRKQGDSAAEGDSSSAAE
jgi:predicted membrane metal-binding protein